MKRCAASSCTISALLQLHETIRTLFGWSDAYPHQFLIRGKPFRVSLNGACNEAGAIRLSDFQFYPRERFFYDYRFDLQTPVWRHDSRVEKVTPCRNNGNIPVASAAPARRRRNL